MELYVQPEHAETIIAIANRFGIEAQQVGRVEAATTKKLTIHSPYGTFNY